MRNITLILAAALLLVSCAGKRSSAKGDKITEEQTSAPIPPKIVNTKPLNRCYPGECEAPTSLAEYKAMLVREKIGLFVRLEEYTPEINKAVEELERYERGERKHYPAEQVKRALLVMTSDQGYYWNHGWESDTKGDLYPNEAYLFRFYEQAVRLCPRIDLLANHLSSDGRVGVVNYQEWNPDPLYCMLIYRRGENLFLQMVGEKADVHIDAIYPLTDAQGRRYYLLSNNLHKPRMHEEEWHRDHQYLDRFFRQFLYEEVCGELVLRCSTASFPFEAFSSKHRIVFSPTELCWKHCTKHGDHYHQVAGTPTLHLTLDGEQSHFKLIE